MKKILVLCDDYWHPGEVVERGMRSIRQERYSFDFVRDARDILTCNFIAGFPAIIVSKGNQINGSNVTPWFEDEVVEVNPEQFLEYVEKGGSLILIHSGVAYTENLIQKEENFRRPNKAWMDMMGCMFQGHPCRCPVTLQVQNVAHPIMKGVENFTERDEHYMIKIKAEDAEILFQTMSDLGGIQTAGFVRNCGKGRIIVLTPGHTLDVWSNPNYQRIIMNALDWVTQSEK